MANIAYVRVSTVDQNDERQREALAAFQIDKWFCEKVSGKDTNRPQLQAMLEFVREGDTVYVHDFSRLARSTADLLNIVDTLAAKGVHLVSRKEAVDSSTPTGKLMLTMIGAIAEFERANLVSPSPSGRASTKGARLLHLPTLPPSMRDTSAARYRLKLSWHGCSKSAVRHWIS